VDGRLGIVVPPRGRLRLVLALRVMHDRVVALDVIAEPEHLRTIDLAVLGS